MILKYRNWLICGPLSWAAVAVLFLQYSYSDARAGFDIIQGDIVKFSDGPGSPGGVFKIDVERTTPTLDFETFCVELTEHIAFNTRYYVENIGLVTVQENKKLGAQSAWLYTQFLNKNDSKLDGYNFINPTSSEAKFQANALQLGIWRGLTDVQTGLPYSWSTIASQTGWSSSYIYDLKVLLKTWLDNFQDDLDANLWSGTGNIQIMSLRKFKYVNGELVPTHYAQDQLVFIDDPLDPHVVPELPTLYSASLLLGGGSLWVAASLFKKRRAALATA